MGLCPPGAAPSPQTRLPWPWSRQQHPRPPPGPEPRGHCLPAGPLAAPGGESLTGVKDQPRRPGEGRGGVGSSARGHPGRSQQRDRRGHPQPAGRSPGPVGNVPIPTVSHPKPHVPPSPRGMSPRSVTRPVPGDMSPFLSPQPGLSAPRSRRCSPPSQAPGPAAIACGSYATPQCHPLTCLALTRASPPGQKHH